MNSEQSPFLYNDFVIGNLFVGREHNLRLLENNIRAGHDTTIYGSRKVGKTSLVSESIRRFSAKNKKHLFLKLDLSQCATAQEFISLFCRRIEELIKETKPLSHSFNELTNFISSIKSVASIDPVTGKVEHSLDFTGSRKNINKTLDDVFDLLESISKNRELTVVLDEFQSIVYWDNNDKIQWKLRSRIQEPNSISFIFLGSSQRLISEIFIESKSAFYKSTNLLYLERNLDLELIFPWIKKQFEKAKLKISDEMIKGITDLTKAHPYYTQKLCYKIWQENYQYRARKFKDLGPTQLSNAILNLLKEERIIYQERFDKLSTKQKQVIKALANSEGAKITTKAMRERFSLSSAASIAVTLKSLEKEINPLIYKEDKSYFLEDPFFELWLQRGV